LFIVVLQAHPKDAEFLNKPIENYKEMMTIFGTGLATGKYAMGDAFVKMTDSHRVLWLRTWLAKNFYM
jgi:hypothetical protein